MLAIARHRCRLTCSRCRCQQDRGTRFMDKPSPRRTRPSPRSRAGLPTRTPPSSTTST
jgi:hypothetical protein